MKLDWSPWNNWIKDYRRFVISSHVRPDADAIGSELGLQSALRGLGKDVTIVNTSQMPAHLKFLDPEGTVRTFSEPEAALAVRNAQVHVVVDTSSWAQLADVGVAMKASQALRIVIDHHVSTDDLGAILFKDTTRESTGSIILDLTEYLGVPLNPLSAQALYTAIATDTGWFRFPATGSGTMRAAATLLDAGVEPARVYKELYEQITLNRLRLAGRVLGRIAVDCEGKLAFTYATQQDFEELGAIPADTEDLVNDCLRIAGTQAAFIAVGLANGQTKVSFRSRCDVSVAAVAETFGGGGHRLAAGATLPGPVLAAVEQARMALVKALTATPTAG